MVAPNHVEAGGIMSSRYDGLDSISALLEVERYRLGDWDEPYARLYAIDCASIVFRYHLPDLTEPARELIQRLLHQTLTLVTAGRENELASIERALMTGLEAASRVTRSVWLVALNAVLPDPFRAAVMSTEAALHASAAVPTRAGRRSRGRASPGILTHRGIRPARLRDSAPYPQRSRLSFST